MPYYSKTKLKCNDNFFFEIRSKKVGNIDFSLDNMFFTFTNYTNKLNIY